MYPVLVKFGHLATIHSYGVFYALGFVCGIGLARHEARRMCVSPTMILNLSFYLMISGIFGARLVYVIINWGQFRNHMLDVIMINRGGLVFYGGFLVATVVGFIWLRRWKQPELVVMDIFAAPLAFGHFLGRIGCFFAGCCYGKTCELPWAVTFTHPESLATPLGVPLHPTQLYEAMANLIIFFLLWGYRKRVQYPGQLFLIYLALYGLSRWGIEFFRGDYTGPMVFGGWTLSQAIGLIVALTAMIFLFIRANGTKNSESGQT